MKNNDAGFASQLELLDGERIDDLQFDGLKLIQNKNFYCFSSDAVLLCNFVKANKNETIIDLCSGSGVVGILAQAKTKAKHLTLVEKQTELFEMSQKSVQLNNLNDVVTCINCDVKDAPTILGSGKADVVCANPPYYLQNQKRMSGNKVIDVAKFEIELTFEDLCKSAEKLLKFGGKFFLVNDSSRIVEILSTLKKYHLEPKTIEFVFPNKKDKFTICQDSFQKLKERSIASNVVLIEAVKHGKNGAKVYYKKTN